MTLAIVKVATPRGFTVFYSGKAGKAWLCEEEAGAFTYAGLEAAKRVADRLARQYAGTGLQFLAAHRQATH